MALRSGRHAIIGDNGFAGWADTPDWQPPALTADERACVQQQIAAYENVILAPGRPEDIAVRITVLLGHWRERDGQSDAERDMIAADWMRIIGRYPTWAVCQAAEEWLTYNNQRNRPFVADIRLLCDAAIREDRLTLRLLKRLAGSADHTEPAPRRIADR